MRPMCWTSPRLPVFALGMVLLAASLPARAELMSDASQFLADYDRLVTLKGAVDADRDAMAADLSTGKGLHQDVKHFFADRLEAAAVRLAKAADRKQMKVDLNFKGTKLEKPTPGTGVPSQDAASYIFNYDSWLAWQKQVELDISNMRNAVAANDAATLAVAVTSFFNDSRARLQTRLQWQEAIRSMKKDTGFKGTGKALPPAGTTLAEHVKEFLDDRAEWERLGALVELDRSNLRAAVQGGQSVESIVNTFLLDRRARHVKGVELARDRKVMRKDVGLSNGSEKESKQGAQASSKDLDRDDESGALDETSDTAGEK
ncbi:MAG: hypothetical protein NTW87_22945 [Planctomycetota bacterium]|nr:hypothetical protein [Planctomycetota bacterium]